MPPKKKVSGFIKLQIQAGAATPAPPVGPALGYYQFFNGVPELAVGAHMAGAAALAAVVTMTVEKLFAVSAVPGDAPVAPEARDRASSTA